MTAYYNEFKPEAAHMLRQLIKDGLIAPGDVDERSITEVQADDIRKYTQCHFFAGIGGWSVALRLAGWDDSRPVWTGSCPCQPFSSAGKQKGKQDVRHLWPEWFRLIAELRPATIFGEQVEAAITHGWLDDVYTDLEGQAYAVGAAVLPACAVGKPHQRKRLWFVGNAEQHGFDGCEERGGSGAGKNQGWMQQLERPDTSKHVAYANINSERGRPSEESGEGQEVRVRSGIHAADAGFDVADTLSAGLEGHGRHEREYDTEGRQEQDGHTGEADFQWVSCPDGKARPVEPRICLLAHGVQHRTPILHAFGNAIVPQVAAEFIKATRTS